MIIIMTGKKKFYSSVRRVRDCYYNWKKKVLVVCLAGARSLLRPEKKSSSRFSGGCAIAITTGKKKFWSSVWRVRDHYYDVWRVRDCYYFYHGSDLCEVIRFLREIECIEFECNEFVLIIFKIDLIHFENPICISST